MSRSSNKPSERAQQADEKRHEDAHDLVGVDVDDERVGGDGAHDVDVGQVERVRVADALDDVVDELVLGGDDARPIGGHGRLVRQLAQRRVVQEHEDLGGGQALLACADRCHRCGAVMIAHQTVADAARGTCCCCGGGGGGARVLDPLEVGQVLEYGEQVVEQLEADMLLLLLLRLLALLVVLDNEQDEGEQSRARALGELDGAHVSAVAVAVAVMMSVMMVAVECAATAATATSQRTMMMSIEQSAAAFSRSGCGSCLVGR